MAKMAAALARLEINGLIMIGGWEALEVISLLSVTFISISFLILNYITPNRA